MKCKGLFLALVVLLATFMAHTAHGGFAPKVDYACGVVGYNSVFAADVNRDGKLDLVVASNTDSTSTVCILVNNGDGTFAAKVDYPVGGAVSFVNHKLGTLVIAADLNDDGKPDLAVCSDGVSVLLNNGNGTFAPKVDYPTGGTSSSVAAVDLNVDGKLDLVVGAAGLGSRVSVFMNNGDGTFAARVSYATLAVIASVCTADFNEDGKPDLAASFGNFSSNTGVQMFINNGDGSFVGGELIYWETTGGTCRASVADFNDDGKPDLALTDGGSVNVLMNNGDATFAPRVEYPGIHASPYDVFAADVDNDGKPDLALSSRDAVSIFRNNGDGSFATPVDYPAGSLQARVFAADLNGDGWLDLAVTNRDAGTVSVLINDVEGTVGPAKGDVNCDGILTATDVVLELNAVFLGLPFPC